MPDDSSKAAPSEPRASLSGSGNRSPGEHAVALTTACHDLAGALAHELRTPLGTIRSWAHILRLNPAGEQVRTAADVIERNAEQLAQLVGDFLDATRIAEGTLQMDEKAIGVAPVVAAAVGQAQPAALARQVQLDCDALDGALGAIVADPDRLCQALRGLLKEAIKAAPRDGRVRVSARREGQVITIGIGANGRGTRALAREDRQLPGAAASATSEAIGIALARRLIELQGGTVSNDDEGAAFTIRLAGAEAAAGS